MLLCFLSTAGFSILIMLVNLFCLFGGVISTLDHYLGSVLFQLPLQSMSVPCLHIRNRRYSSISFVFALNESVWLGIRIPIMSYNESFGPIRYVNPCGPLGRGWLCVLTRVGFIRRFLIPPFFFVRLLSLWGQREVLFVFHFHWCIFRGLSGRVTFKNYSIGSVVGE